jgi:uncharacterized phage-associated protein
MDIYRLKAIVLYVLNSVQGKCLGKHELFKVLYFASQKHLIRYGSVMISDFYAFQYGPVPSKLCDYLNGRDNPIISSLNVDTVAKYILYPKEKPDMDELSESDVICLDESIAEYGRLPFPVLTEMSHDSAWSKAWSHPVGSRGDKIDIVDIAIAAEADEQTIEYIKEELEFEAALR